MINLKRLIGSGKKEGLIWGNVSKSPIQSISSKVKMPTMANMRKTMGGFGAYSKAQTNMIKKTGLHTNLLLPNDGSMIPRGMDCKPKNKSKHNIKYNQNYEVETEHEARAEPEVYNINSESDAKRFEEKYSSDDDEDEKKFNVKKHKQQLNTEMEEYRMERDQDRGFFGNIRENIKRKAKKTKQELGQDISRSFGYVYENPAQKRKLREKDLRKAGAYAKAEGVSDGARGSIFGAGLTALEKTKYMKKLTKLKREEKAKKERLAHFSDLKAKREAMASFFTVKAKRAAYQNSRASQPQRSNAGLVNYMRGSFSSYVKNENQHFSNGELDNFMIAGKSKRKKKRRFY